MAGVAGVREEVLDDPEETADPYGETEFLLPFAGEGGIGGFAGVGVTAGEGPFPVTVSLVEEDVAGVEADAGGADVEADVVGFEDDQTPVPPVVSRGWRQSSDAAGPGSPGTITQPPPRMPLAKAPDSRYPLGSTAFGVWVRPRVMTAKSRPAVEPASEWRVHEHDPVRFRGRRYSPDGRRRVVRWG